MTESTRPDRPSFYRTFRSTPPPSRKQSAVAEEGWRVNGRWGVGLDPKRRFFSCRCTHMS